MVVIELKGGLGNQLFEYALGRRLAQINRVPLKLDIETGFAADSFHRRTYSLGVFRTIQSFASERDRRTAWTPRRSYRTARFLQCVRQCLPRRLAETVPAYGSTVHTEQTEFAFDPEVLRPTTNHVVLRGYWQNPKYLSGMDAVLRREIVLRDPMSKRANEYAEQIKTVPAVGLHVRRRFGYAQGRYDAATERFHGILPIEYYRTAMDLVLNQCPDAHLFVFADDPSWAAANIHFPCETTHVSGNQDYEDLVLMSRCRHQIIANSSFGWWGAWLNPNPGKRVVAPRAFMEDPDYDTSDVYPEDWVRI